MSSQSAIYTNPQAQRYNLPDRPKTEQCRKLHQQLPNFTSTSLKSLPTFATTHNLRAVFVKEEGTRAGLPAYKILGASWATFRAICKANNLSLDSSLDEVAAVAKERGYTFFAATAGNHGRALARLANLMKINAHIFVDPSVKSSMVSAIESEGATVTIVEGGYTDALDQAAKTCLATPNGLQIQDFAFGDYTTIPKWHVEGYAALFAELEEQLADQGLNPTHIVVPCGGGTLCHAAVEFAKSRATPTSVLAVEPTASPCLQRSLQTGSNLTVPEGSTIMGGMVGPKVSPISWPVLSQGIDTSVVITDADCLSAAEYLADCSVKAGFCGAGSFAGFRSIVENAPAAFHLTPESVVVVVATDGQVKN